jgi:hypothetical protein
MGRRRVGTGAAIAALALVAAAGDPVAPAMPAAPPAPIQPQPGLRALPAFHGPRISAGVRVGRSADGRPIMVTASGDPDARERVLVVGCIHRTECAGMAVARRVAREPGGLPPDAAGVAGRA